MISRDDLMADSEDSFEDPFAAPGGERSDSEEPSIHTELIDSGVNLLRNAGKNEEIGKDEAFGERNEEVINGFVSKGNKYPSWNSLSKENYKNLENKEGGDERDRSFESLESERKYQFQASAVSEGSENEESGISEEEDINRENEWLLSDHERAANDPSEDSSREKPESGDEEDRGTSLENDTSISSDEEVSDASSAFDTDTESTSPPMTNERATLRKMMAESQKTIAANLSKAAKSDVAKGRAIKQQRSTFDTLLSTRLRLQKALIATNTLPTTSRNDTKDDEVVRAAENAALKLWSTLDSLRSSLYTESEPQTLEPDSSTSLSSLWARMQFHETHFHAHRRAILDKWSLKTAPPSSLSRSKLLSQSTQLPLSSVLDQQLSGSNMQKLLSRSRTPRSCAPAQASAVAAAAGNRNTTAAATEDPNIYDDADFYAQLLRELVDQRKADVDQSDGLTVPIGNGVNGIPGIKDRSLRVKKNVDTKASKGRKIRYTVHEKLQNFMAPEDRGSWGERQRDELFRGLLGRRVKVDEGEEDDDRIDKAEEGLRLFRS